MLNLRFSLFILFHQIDSNISNAANPFPTPVTSTMDTVQVHNSERSDDDDRALDPAYVHVELSYNNHAMDDSNLDPCFISSGVSTILL